MTLRRDEKCYSLAVLKADNESAPAGIQTHFFRDQCSGQPYSLAVLEEEEEKSSTGWDNYRQSLAPNLKRAKLCGTNLKLMRKKRIGRMEFEPAPYCLLVERSTTTLLVPSRHLTLRVLKKSALRTQHSLECDSPRRRHFFASHWSSVFRLYPWWLCHARCRRSRARTLRH